MKVFKALKVLLAGMLGVMLVIALTGCSKSSSSGNGSSGESANSESSGETPVSNNEEPGELTLGDTFSFDDFDITLDPQISTVTIDNEFSENNGATVIVVPISVTNQSSESRSLNMFYIKVFGSKGTELDNISSYFMDDDIYFAGEARPGASIQSNLHFLYDGDGDYYVNFNNFAEDIEVKLPGLTVG